MYPNDAKTVYHELVGAGSYNVTNNDGPNTILAVAVQQSNISSDSVVKCENDVVARNYATNFSNVTMNYQCEGDILISKTGNDNAAFIITYVPYLTGDYSTTTQFGYNPHVGIASSSEIQYYGAFSAGELLIAFILLLHFGAFLLGLLVQAIRAMKTKKTYIGYKAGDVPIDDEL